jgi:hypothetical protein
MAKPGAVYRAFTSRYAHIHTDEITTCKCLLGAPARAAKDFFRLFTSVMRPSCRYGCARIWVTCNTQVDQYVQVQLRLEHRLQKRRHIG